MKKYTWIIAIVIALAILYFVSSSGVLGNLFPGGNQTTSTTTTTILGTTTTVMDIYCSQECGDRDYDYGQGVPCQSYETQIIVDSTVCCCGELLPDMYDCMWSCYNRGFGDGYYDPEGDDCTDDWTQPPCCCVPEEPFTGCEDGDAWAGFYSLNGGQCVEASWCRDVEGYHYDYCNGDRYVYEWICGEDDICARRSVYCGSCSWYDSNCVTYGSVSACSEM